jgi:hypothetical protein
MGRRGAERDLTVHCKDEEVQKVAVNDVFHNLTAYRGYGHKAMV